MSTPTLTELAAPVLLMAEAHVTHLVSMGIQNRENVAALVAFKRALKKAEVPEPTAHDALIAEARRLAEILPLENMSAWGHKVTLIADALTAERAAREDLYGEAREPKNLHRYTAVELFLKAKYCDALTMINEVAKERDTLRSQLAEAQKKADAHDMAQTHIFKNAPLDPECPATDGRLITDVQNLVRHAVRMQEQLSEAREQLALCASNTTAADLAQEVEFLKAERDGIIAALGYGGDEDAWPSGCTIAEAVAAMRKELSRLGPVEEEYNAAEKMGWKPVTQDGWTQSWLRDVKPFRRLIRRVLPTKESSDVPRS